jgi:hypothetical protein
MLDKHRHLRGNTARHLAETKSLQRLRKRCFGTFRYRPNASLSKRAPSTTRTSLRTCRINGLRASGSAPNPNCDRNCDTPPKGLRSPTGTWSATAVRTRPVYRRPRRDRVIACAPVGFAVPMSPAKPAVRRISAVRRPVSPPYLRIARTSLIKTNRWYGSVGAGTNPNRS